MAMEMELEVPAGEMGTLDAMIAALVLAKDDAEFSAAVDAGEVMCTIEENGDVTLTAGSASKTVTASQLMGEDEGASEDAMPEAAE